MMFPCFLRALCCCLVCIFSHEWNIVSKRYGGIITAVLLEMVILLYCYVVSSSLREIVFFFHEKFRGKHSLFYGQFFFPRNSHSNLTPCNFFRGAFDCFMCTYWNEKLHRIKTITNWKGKKIYKFIKMYCYPYG